MNPPLAFEADWLSAEGLPRGHGRELLRLLDALQRSGSLSDAARSCGLSYRHAWNVVGEGADVFGTGLVEMKRGRGARLTAAGQRLLAADSHFRGALEPAFERLREEMRGLLQGPVAERQSRLALRASHDLALGELARACAPRLALDIDIQGAEDSLAALSRGECDLAGFHVADALPRAAAAAAALGQWLDPRRHQLVYFVTREQGLIVRPGARIRGVNDLARPGVRFAGRPQPGGRNAALADLQVAEEVAAGRADAGFGLRAAAARLHLDFVHLATERYFLAASRRTLRSPAWHALLGVLRGRDFGRRVSLLPGYDPSRSGEQESVAAALSWIGKGLPPRSPRNHA